MRDQPPPRAPPHEGNGTVSRGIKVLIVAAVLAVSCSGESEAPSQADAPTTQSTPAATPTPGITEDDVAEIEDAVRDYRAAGDENDFAARQDVSTGALSDYYGLMVSSALDKNSLPLSTTAINDLEVEEVDGDSATVAIDAVITPWGEAPEPVKMRGTYSVIRTPSGWKIADYTERNGEPFSANVYTDLDSHQEHGGLELSVVGVDLSDPTYATVFVSVQNHSDKRYSSYEALLLDGEGNQHTGNIVTESSILPGAKLSGMYQFPLGQDASDSKQLRLAVSYYDETSYSDDLEFDVDVKLR